MTHLTRPPSRCGRPSTRSSTSSACRSSSWGCASTRTSSACARCSTTATPTAWSSQAALAADDEIDAMHVSLLERCYLLLGREAPMASDLRFLVSVVRILVRVRARRRPRRCAWSSWRPTSRSCPTAVPRGTSCARWSRWPSSSTAPRCGPGRRRTSPLATQLVEHRPRLDVLPRAARRRAAATRRPRRRGDRDAPVRRRARRPTGSPITPPSSAPASATSSPASRLTWSPRSARSPRSPQVRTMTNTGPAAAAGPACDHARVTAHSVVCRPPTEPLR